MDLRLECEGFASIQRNPEDREYVCPYSGEFIDNGEMCLVLKERESESIDGVWFILEYIPEFVEDVCTNFEKGVEKKKYQGSYDIFKMTEAVRFGKWEPEQKCLACGDLVESDHESVYFIGLGREGFEFVHFKQECIYTFRDLIRSVDEYSAEICSTKL